MLGCCFWFLAGCVLLLLVSSSAQPDRDISVYFQTTSCTHPNIILEKPQWPAERYTLYAGSIIQIQLVCNRSILLYAGSIIQTQWPAETYIRQAECYHSTVSVSTRCDSFRVSYDAIHSERGDARHHSCHTLMAKVMFLVTRGPN